MEDKSKNKINIQEIPVGGTLGLLAYGYRGIMIWRERRHLDKLNSKKARPHTSDRNEILP